MIFRKKKPQTVEANGGTASPSSRASQERLAACQRLGHVADDVLAPVISASLMGAAPAWPLREAHRVITTDDGHLIFATDGLTEDFADGRPGLGYELLMKIPKPAGFASVADATQIFEFGVHREMAMNALVWPDLRPILAESGAISMVLPSDVGASPFVADINGEGQVGALIGTFTIADPVHMLGITLVLPDEVRALEAGGPETRPALAHALERDGVGWTSLAQRTASSID